MSRTKEDITTWGDRIASAIGMMDACCVGDVYVYRRVASTQDAAWRHRKPGAGVAAVASEQTTGRGSQGRRWYDGAALTLPMSFVLHTPLLDVGLAARAGLAAMDACRHAGVGTNADILIKWPNDVIVRTGAGDRKLAGVLIERWGGIPIVGVGINVYDDRPNPDKPRDYESVSIHALGGQTERCALAIGLIRSMTRWLGASDQDVRRCWGEHDGMVGTERGFVVDGVEIRGTVTALDPLSSIRVRTESGEQSVPVATARTI